MSRVGVPRINRRWDVRAALISTLLITALPGRAFAHASGMAVENCSCHNGGGTPTVLLTPDLTEVRAGQLMNLTVSVSTTNGKTAGFFLEASAGTLSVVDSGTKLSGGGVVQNAARTGTGSAITFKVGWTAPATPGGVDFHVWANSANGNGAPSGDGEGAAFYSTVYGCTGQKFYRDADGDGVGSEASGYTMACTQPEHYSSQAGDCADDEARNFPGNLEICDGRDNNCDGQVDEGLDLVTRCQDADGDGHGVLGKATIVGCTGNPGFGLCDADCDDKDPAVYPGATEICNSRDDNCNQQVDENARPSCGVGWCRRYAPDCNSPCVPAEPLVEACNDYDDDCDGVKDNGTDLALCGQVGLVCRAGSCVAGSGDTGGVANPSQGGSTGAGGSASKPGSSSGAAGEGPALAPRQPPGCSAGRSNSPTPLAQGMLLALAAWHWRRRRRSSALASMSPDALRD